MSVQPGYSWLFHLRLPAKAKELTYVSSSFFIEVLVFWRGACLAKAVPLQYKIAGPVDGVNGLVELAGYILDSGTTNVWLYNLFLPLESVLYICFFYLISPPGHEVAVSLSAGGDRPGPGDHLA